MIWGGLLRLALIIVAVLFDLASGVNSLNPLVKSIDVNSTASPDGLQQKNNFSVPLSNNKYDYDLRHPVENNATHLKESSLVASKGINNVNVDENTADTHLNRSAANAPVLMKDSKLRPDEMSSKTLLSKALDIILNRNQIIKTTNQNAFQSFDSEAYKINVNNDNAIRNMDLQQISNDYNNLLTDKIIGLNNQTNDVSFSWIITDVSIITEEPFNYLDNTSDPHTNKSSSVTLNLNRTNMVKELNTVKESNMMKQLNTEKEFIYNLRLNTLSPRLNLQKFASHEISNKASSSSGDLVVREDVMLTHTELTNGNDVIRRPISNATVSNMTFGDKNADSMHSPVNKMDRLVNNNKSNTNNNNTLPHSSMFQHSIVIEENRSNILSKTSKITNHDKKIQTVTNTIWNISSGCTETAIRSLFEVKKINGDLLAENIPDINKQLQNNKILVNNDYNVSRLFVSKTDSTIISNAFQNLSFLTGYLTATPMFSYSLKNVTNETNNALPNRTDLLLQSNQNMGINNSYISGIDVPRSEKKSMLKNNIKNEDLQNNMEDKVQINIVDTPSTLCTNIPISREFVTNSSYDFSNVLTTTRPQLFMNVTPTRLSPISHKVNVIFQPRQFVYSTPSLKGSHSDVMCSMFNFTKATALLPTFDTTTKMKSVIETSCNNSYIRGETNNMKMSYTKYYSDVLQAYVGKTMKKEILMNTRKANYTNHLTYLEPTKCIEDDQFNRRVYHQYTVFEKHEENIESTSANKNFATDIDSQLMFKINNFINNRNTMMNISSENTVVTSGNTSLITNYSSQSANITTNMNITLNNFTVTSSIIYSPLSIETTTVSGYNSEYKLESIRNSTKQAKFVEIFKGQQLAKANLQQVVSTKVNIDEAALDLGKALVNKSNNVDISTLPIVNNFNTIKFSKNELNTATSKIDEKLLISISNDFNSRLINDSKPLNLDLKNAPDSVITASVDKKEPMHTIHKTDLRLSTAGVPLVRDKIFIERVKLKKEFNEDKEESDGSLHPVSGKTNFIGLHSNKITANFNDLDSIYMNNSTELTFRGFTNMLLDSLVKPNRSSNTPSYGLEDIDSHYYRVDHNNHFLNKINNCSASSIAISKPELNNSELLTFNSNLNSHDKQLISYLGESKYSSNNNNNAIRYNFVVEPESNSTSPERLPLDSADVFLDSKPNCNSIGQSKLFNNNNAQYLQSNNISNTTNKFSDILINKDFDNLNITNPTENINNSKYKIDFSTKNIYLNDLDKVKNGNVQAGITSLQINNKQNNKNTYLEVSKSKTLMPDSDGFIYSALVNTTERYDSAISNHQPLHNTSLSTASFNWYNRLNHNTSLNNLLHKPINIYSTTNNIEPKMQSLAFVNISLPKINKQINSSIAQMAAVINQNETPLITENYRDVNEMPLNIVSDHLSVENTMISTEVHGLTSNIKATVLGKSNKSHMNILPQLKNENYSTNTFDGHSSKQTSFQTLSGNSNNHNTDSQFNLSNRSQTDFNNSTTGVNNNTNSIIEIPLNKNLSHTAVNVDNKHIINSVKSKSTDKDLNSSLSNSNDHIINFNIFANTTYSNLDPTVNNLPHDDIYSLTEPNRGISKNNLFRTLSIEETILHNPLSKAVSENYLGSESKAVLINHKWTPIDRLDSKSTKTFWVKLPLVSQFPLKDQSLYSEKISDDNKT